MNPFLARALALMLALFTAGCNVDVTPAEFDVKYVQITSIASDDWDVRVAFELADQTVHEQTVRVGANNHTSLLTEKIGEGNYTIRASTSAHATDRTMPLNGHTRGITITVVERGMLGISIIR